MEITYHNGKRIERNDYITLEKDDIYSLLLEGQQVSVVCLPKLHTPEWVDLRYLTYGARTFVIYKNTKEKIQRFYTYEQKIVHNKMEVVDYMATTIIPYDHPLRLLINNTEYNKEYDIQAMCELTNYLERISYMINQYSIYNQIVNFVFPITKDTEYREEPQKGKTLTEIAKEVGIPYKTLWGRIKQHKMSLEEAVNKGYEKGKSKIKRKHPEVTYNGKNLKELSKEYNIPYQKLWCRVHKHKWTIEKALGIER